MEHSNKKKKECQGPVKIKKKKNTKHIADLIYNALALAGLTVEKYLFMWNIKAQNIIY